MKVLWVVNFALPEVSESDPAQMPFGGWVGSMLRQLKSVSGLSIGLAMKSEAKCLRISTVDEVRCYWIPRKSTNRFDISQSDCEKVLKDFAPDILHLEGTEQAHSLRFISTWKGKNVVSLQGLINEIEPHEYGGLSIRDLLLTPSFQVIVFGLSLWANKQFFFRPRLASERATLAKAQNFLGRTGWDRAHSHQRNPSAEYFSCSRILREEFYGMAWSPKRKQTHSIIVGNSSIARKGFHIVLEAVSILKSDFPDIKIRVAGPSPFPRSISDWKKYVGYPAYVRYLVKKLELGNQVEFLGFLPAEDMANSMCSAHVFVLPSSIENSPNTLGEAMAMGVPCVSADVGGVPDMAIDEEEALLYQSDDPAQMADQIRRVFEDSKLAARLSENGRKRAMETHHPKMNADRLLFAYEQISGKLILRATDLGQ